jgi:hypothetical protein
VHMYHCLDHQIIIELLLKRFYGGQMITKPNKQVNNCSNETIFK